MSITKSIDIAREPDSGPWYRHFWPWFLLGLLMLSVVGSSAAAWIAYHTHDTVIEHADSAD